MRSVSAIHLDFAKQIIDQYFALYALAKEETDEGEAAMAELPVFREEIVAPVAIQFARRVIVMLSEREGLNATVDEVLLEWVNNGRWDHKNLTDGIVPTSLGNIARLFLEEVVGYLEEMPAEQAIEKAIVTGSPGNITPPIKPILKLLAAERVA